jgi:NAD(P)-dependent dehydrogenase (short-subunit alcohol dehydrogenase family)
MAGYGPYAGTKFALEAVSDALRREVADFGVKVVVIEPGAVTTEMTGRLVIAAERITSGMSAEQHGRYDALMQAVIAQAQRFTREGVGLPAEAAGRVIADAIISERPRTRYTVGRDAAIIVRLARFVSDRMLDSLLARTLKRRLPKAVPTP